MIDFYTGLYSNRAARALNMMDELYPFPCRCISRNYDEFIKKIGAAERRPDGEIVIKVDEEPDMTPAETFSRYMDQAKDHMIGWRAGISLLCPDKSDDPVLEVLARDAICLASEWSSDEKSEQWMELKGRPLDPFKSTAVELMVAEREQMIREWMKYGLEEFERRRRELNAEIALIGAELE